MKIEKIIEHLKTAYFYYADSCLDAKERYNKAKTKKTKEIHKEAMEEYHCREKEVEELIKEIEEKMILELEERS